MSRPHKERYLMANTTKDDLSTVIADVRLAAKYLRAYGFSERVYPHVAKVLQHRRDESSLLIALCNDTNQPDAFRGNIQHLLEQLGEVSFWCSQLRPIPPGSDAKGKADLIDELADMISKNSTEGDSATYLGNGRIKISNMADPMLVAVPTLVTILEYLVEHRKATTDELIDKAKVSNPSGLVKGLQELQGGLLKPFIFRPRDEHRPNKSEKGYSTAITDGRNR